MKRNSIVFISFLALFLLIIGHIFEDSNCIARATIIDNAENETPAYNPIKIISNEVKSSHMDLPEGWSMISLPLCLDNKSVSSLFPHAEVAYGYERGEGYRRVEELECGKGYWILMNEAQCYPLTGQSIDEYTWTIDEHGWGLIGGCTYPTKISMDDENIMVIYRYVQAIGYQQVPESEKLDPGEGYWILLNNIIDQEELKAYGICDIKIILNETRNFPMDLPQGWSMISLPLCPNNKSVLSLFSGAVVNEYCKGGEESVQVHALECGRGYWILVEKAQIYPLSGRSIKEYTWRVNEDGWKLIGGCACPAQVSIVNGDIVCIYQFVQSSGYSRIQHSNPLKPGKGFWILLNNITEQAVLRVYGICDM